MAIKGKSKSKARSGASKRRPGAPPRPAAAASHHTPWYRTMAGQLSAIVVVLAIIGTVMWRVSATQAADERRSARQDELADYTSKLSDFVGDIQEPVREMLGAPFNTANPEAIVALEESAPRWAEQLEKTGAMVQGLVPPLDLVAMNTMFQQSFLMYSTSAKTYALVPGEESDKRTQELLDRASELREQAGIVLGAAVGLLDGEREEAGMRPSAIQQPSQMTPILPTPEPVPTDEATEDPKKGDKNNDG